MRKAKVFNFGIYAGDLIELDKSKKYQFNYAEDVTNVQIKDAIRTYLQELKSQEGRLPQLRTALIGDVIEV